MAIHPVQATLNKARKDKFLLVLNVPTILRDLNVRGERADSFFNLDSLQWSVYLDVTLLDGSDYSPTVKK